MAGDSYPQKRQSDECPDITHHSPNGLNFVTHCHQGFKGDQSNQRFEYAENVEECMDICSVNRPRCYAVAFNIPNSRCGILGNTALNNSDSGLLVDSDYHVAVADHSQLQGSEDVSCLSNGTNGSMVAGGGGLFSVLCNQDFVSVGDYRPYSLPGYAYPPHANSLEECTNICLRAHPYCNAITWNPSMDAGFGNCYVKTGVTARQASPPLISVAHSAILEDAATDVTDGCPDDNSYIARPDSIEFQVNCSISLQDSQNFTSIHESSFSGCMDVCAGRNDSDCLGVLFDPAMMEGYDNCYLLNDTGTADTGSYIFAKNVGPVPSESQPDGGIQGQPAVGSKNNATTNAWIAGPVVGVLVFAALVGFALWWFWRRRQRQQQPKPSFEQMAEPKMNYPEYDVHHEVDGMPVDKVYMLPSDNERYELRDPNAEQALRHEMAAR